MVEVPYGEVSKDQPGASLNRERRFRYHQENKRRLRKLSATRVEPRQIPSLAVHDMHFARGVFCFQWLPQPCFGEGARQTGFF